MDIQKFEFKPSNPVNDEPSLVGVDIVEDETGIYINLVGLSENKGSPVTPNLWTIAPQVARHFLPDHKIETLKWSFTYGSNSSDIKFSKFRSARYKLDYQNMWAPIMERCDRESGQQVIAGTIDQYLKGYKSIRPFKIRDENALAMRFNKPQPGLCFTIPCPDPQARDGVLRFQPINSAKPNSHEYILADKGKLLTAASHANPNIRDALKKFSLGAPATDFLKQNVNYPVKASRCLFDDKNIGVALDEIIPTTLGLGEYFDLPFVPVAVPSSEGEKKIKAIKHIIGFCYNGPEDEPDMRPAFEPG